MDVNFWQQRWENNQIGFHQPEANALLQAHVTALALSQRSRVFLPLCGKTLDIAWLLTQGYQVVGVELSSQAVEELFASLTITPEVSVEDKMTRYSAPDIDIYVGNIFDLTANQLGTVAAIYDRAALVALPSAMRSDYRAQLMALTDTAPQLLISYQYDQDLVNGPPFSVDNDEVTACYGPHYQLKLLKSQRVPGGLKGKYPATECVWLLTQKVSQATI